MKIERRKNPNQCYIFKDLDSSRFLKGLVKETVSFAFTVKSR
jgi:hypothetical protein